MNRSALRFLAGMLIIPIISWTTYSQQDNGEGLSKSDVVELAKQYDAEHDHLIKTGADKRFLPSLLRKAEQMAARGKAALENGRLQQAAKLLRQARWQLPYQSPQIPETHVAKVLGNVRLRHSGAVLDVEFSPDGQRMATAGRDRSVVIWDIANGHELIRYSGHGDYVRVVSFGPEGKIIASAGGDDTIHVWNPANGEKIREIKAGGQYVKDLAVTPDGKYVVAANDDQAVRVFDMKTGEVKREITDFQQDAQCLTFNPKGDILAVGVGDGMIRLWAYPQMVDNPKQPDYWAKQDFSGATYGIAFSGDNKTMARLGPLGIKIYDVPRPDSSVIVTDPRFSIDRLHDKFVFTSAEFSKDGQTLYAGDNEGVIRIWDMYNGQAKGVLKGHKKIVNALALAPSGNRLASASDDFTVRLWDFNIVLESRALTGHDGPVWMASFNPDGSRIVSAGADKTARVWDFATGNVVRTLESTDPITAAMYSPNGNIIVTAGGDTTLTLWNSEMGKKIKTLKGHTGTVTAVAFDATGSKIVSGSVDKTIRVWDAVAGNELMRLEADPSVVMAVAIRPDGKQIATGHVDQSLRLWDAQTGKLQRSWSAHGIAVTSLAYSPDGKWLASTGADHLAHVWSVDSPGSSPIALTGHDGPLSSVAFRNDSTHLVTCGSDRVVKLWKIEPGGAQVAQDFRGHKDWVTSVAFSKDGYFIASASMDRSIRIWEITSREIPLQAEHTGKVVTVAISPDGKLIASGGSDRTIKIWNREKGVELQTLYGHTEAILDLAFSPDGKMLVSASADRSVKRWNVEAGEEISFAAGEGRLFEGLIQPARRVQVTPDNKSVLLWIPGDERYTTVAKHELKTSFEEFSVNVANHHFLSVAFSADGSRALLGSKKGTAVVLDLQNKGKQIGNKFAMFDDKGITGLAVSADGSFAIAANEKGTLMLFDTTKHTVKHTINVSKFAIDVVAISRDGKYFATSGHDNVVRLWDVATGKELRRWNANVPLQYGRGFVGDMEFSPDGRYLITANANTTVYVLETPE